MKRNINLQELSRDHHHGLLLGWKIRQGLKYEVSPNIIAEYVAYFFVEALSPHFKEEENLVLKYLPDNDGFKNRTLKEHNKISDIVRSLASTPAVKDSLLELAQTVDSHIRFEERELFPYIEQLLDSDTLEKVGAAIASCHQPFEDNYPLQFWNKNH